MCHWFVCRCSILLCDHWDPAGPSPLYEIKSSNEGQIMETQRVKVRYMWQSPPMRGESCWPSRLKSVVRDKVLRWRANHVGPAGWTLLYVTKSSNEGQIMLAQWVEVRCTWQSPPMRGMILEVVTPNDEWYHVKLMILGGTIYCVLFIILMKTILIWWNVYSILKHVFYRDPLHQVLSQAGGYHGIGIVGTSSNKVGEFSCIYITLGDLKCLPFVEAVAYMSKLLKHTDVTQLLSEHLKFTKDWKSFVDPIRGTFLPNFFIIYFGQEIPQGSISSDDVKTAMAKMGPGYALWVSTVSDAIDNIDDINYIIDAFSTVNDLSLSNFYKKHFYVLYDKDTSLSVSGAPYGTITMVPSDAYSVEIEAIKKIFLLVQYKLPQAPVTASAITLSFRGMLRKRLWPRTVLKSWSCSTFVAWLILRAPLSIPSVLLCFQRVWTSLWTNLMRAKLVPFLTYCVSPLLSPGRRISSTSGPPLLLSDTSQSLWWPTCCLEISPVMKPRVSTTRHTSSILQSSFPEEPRLGQQGD